MSPKPRTIRFGVIGCGVIAYWTHLRELSRVKNAILVAAADPDENARTKAARLARITVYEHPDELLRRDDIDAVVICVPTHLHAQLAISSARAHKHFYLEKPIASTLEDASRVIEAAQCAGVVSAIGFNRRLHPVFEQSRALIAAGRIGRVRAVVTACCEPVSPGSMPQWKKQRSTGGGVLLDLASHHIDYLRWFLNGEVTGVEARLNSELSEDDTASLRLVMQDGVEVASFFSFRAGLTDFLEFIGERGSLRVDRHRGFLSLRAGRRFGYGQRTLRIFPGRDVLAYQFVRLRRPSYEPSYRRALEAFVELINGGQPRLATLNDGLRSLEIIHAAEKSARDQPELAATSVRG